MYNLVNEISFGESLNLKYVYRYGFIRFNRNEKVESDPLYGSVFVFRTEVKGSTNQRILIDLIDSRTVNAFDVALHNNAHIHIINLDEIFGRLDHEGLVKQEITEDIDVLLIQNEPSIECHALIKKQQYKKRMKNNESTDVCVEEIKYLLYTEYSSDVVNMYRRFLAHNFSLQEEYHLVNIQYKKIERFIDTADTLQLQEDVSWLENQIKIKEKKEELQREKENINSEILDIISEQIYIP